MAVIGGGNTALQDAAFLANYCNKVYLVHRRDEFRGEAGWWKCSENVKCRVCSECSPESDRRRTYGDRTDPDKSEDKRRFQLDVNGIFVAIGHAPKNELFAELVELDEAGFIKAGETV